MNKLFIIVIFSTLPLSIITAKSKKDDYIESAQQFQRWCKLETQRYFKRRKITPYNWSASTYRQLNDYKTHGRWKIGRNEIEVLCQIRIGDKAKYTQIKIPFED